MPTPPKVALNQRLHREGRHAEFIAVREQLKREGIPEQLAWLYAAARFPPLDGSPLEVKVPRSIEASPPSGDESGTVLGDGDGPPTAAELRSDVAAFMAAAEIRSEADQTFDDLHGRVDKNRKAGIVTTIQWLFDFAGTSFAEIEPAEVPTRGALPLLRSIQSSEKRYGEFLTGVWSKIIHVKSQLDSEGRFHDDGRELVLMEEFEREFYAANGQ